MRALISLGVLRELEARFGRPLSGAFDYISGTSTGAIVAGCLAIGMTVDDVEDFYRDFGQRIFTPQRRPRRWIASRYGAADLEAVLRQVLKLRFGGTEPDLRPEFLQCLFMAVLRNATTDAVWPISSNPAAKFNDPLDSDCNLRLPMWEVMRASSAAPTYFPPRDIVLNPTDPESAFRFVDGGTTAYNNPSFLTFVMATASPYQLRWETGEDRMLIVSIGTGMTHASSQQPGSRLPWRHRDAQATFGSLMHQSSVEQDMNCRVVGRCIYGHDLGYEVGDLIPVDGSGRLVSLETDLRKEFLYARFNVYLENESLEQLGITGIDPDLVRRLDATSEDAIHQLSRIGAAVGREVHDIDFGHFV